MADTHRRYRLVAALTLLRDQLGPVVDELIAGELSREAERRLAKALRMIAADLDPVIESS
jgi:hypothetical protein